MHVITLLLMALCSAGFAVPSQAQKLRWEDAGIPGASITSISGYGNLLYASSEGAMYMSADNGTSWSRTPLPYPLKNVTNLRSGNGFTIGIDVDAEYRLAISVGGGAWQDVTPNFPDDPTVNHVAVEGDSIWIRASRGIYRSTDMARSWIPVDTTSMFAWKMDWMVVHHQTIYTAYREGPSIMLNRTSDQGRTWTQVWTDNNTHSITSFAHSPEALFIGTRGQGLLKSTDDGVTWVKMESATLPVDIGFVSVRQRASSYDLIVGGSMWMFRNGHYVSSDSGRSWTFVRTGNASVCGFSDSEGRGHTWVGGRIGISYITESQTDWSFTADGMDNLRASAIAHYADTLYATAAGSVFTSADHGTSWARLDAPDVDHVGLAVDSSVLVVYAYDSAYVSTDRGSTWTGRCQLLLPGTEAYVTLHNRAIYTGNYAGECLRSTDQGITWEPTVISPGRPVTSIVSAGNALLAKLDGTGVFRSMDDGTTWTDMNGSDVFNYQTDQFFYENGYLFVWNSQTFHISSDLGDTWKPHSDGIVLPARSSFTSYDSAYYIVPEFEAMANDTGTVWKSVSERLPSKSLSVICMVDSTLLVSTQYHGIQRTTISKPTSVPMLSNDAYMIYPQPSRSSVVVRGAYADGPVRAWSTMGQAADVRTGSLPGGCTIDVSELPVGIWMVQLRDASGRVRVAKLDVY